MPRVVPFPGGWIGKAIGVDGTHWDFWHERGKESWEVQKGEELHNPRP